MGLFWKAIDPLQMVGHIITFMETEDSTGNVLFQASNGSDFMLFPNGGQLNLIDGDMADLIDSPITHASAVTGEYNIERDGSDVGYFQETVPWAKFRFETANGYSEFFFFEGNVEFKTR